ncbi:inverse autotransporter beta domain-containing protein [Enterobacteriaceae endosymbiont of Neohaemonia nigricornis]|uniref:inverse autotransporter beta domain-containing protein n=1 Tax=Enterobacteriaceae endosymbiont of Neohaemonia nigricornis TaxID=2675792 RepID=UPI001B3AEEF3|nr:inverse autotransporter beta domain-containing protein [Enterobacteriaceae endosymbiont of Neohaemonia nigricornis]
MKKYANFLKIIFCSSTLVSFANIFIVHTIVNIKKMNNGFINSYIKKKGIHRDYDIVSKIVNSNFYKKQKRKVNLLTKDSLMLRKNKGRLRAINTKYMLSNKKLRTEFINKIYVIDKIVKIINNKHYFINKLISINTIDNKSTIYILITESNTKLISLCNMLLHKSNKTSFNTINNKNIPQQDQNDVQRTLKTIRIKNYKTIDNQIKNINNFFNSINIKNYKSSLGIMFANKIPTIIKLNLKIFAPIIDKKDFLFFIQNNFNFLNQRKQINIGLGIRKFFSQQNCLLGANNFVDYDLTLKQKRIGFGIEFWQPLIKLNANIYIGLNGWKQIQAPNKNYTEQITTKNNIIMARPVNGFDIIATGSIPKIPKIIFNLKYNKNFHNYFFNKIQKNIEKNKIKYPSIFSFGINYQINSILNIILEKEINGGENNTTLGIGLNLNLNKSINEQTHNNKNQYTNNFNKLNKYDFVNRNDNIIIEYIDKKIEKVSIKNTNIINYPSTNNIIEIYNAKLIKNIEFKYNNNFLINKGKIVNNNNNNIIVILPKYISKNNSDNKLNNQQNNYNIKVIIEDIYKNKQNFEIKIQVLCPTKQQIDQNKSILKICTDNTKYKIPKNIKVCFYAKDKNNNAISNIRDIKFIVKNKDIETQFTNITEKPLGVYCTDILINTIGENIIKVKINNNTYENLSKKVIFTGNNEITNLYIFNEKTTYKAKISDHVNLKLKIITEDKDAITKPQSIIIKTLSIKNRQQIDMKNNINVKPKPLHIKNLKTNITLINNDYKFMTDENGELHLQISSPDGLGVKTTLSININNNNKIIKIINFIFTVPTSPDIDKANMYGHMQDTIMSNNITLHRPPLYAEYIGGKNDKLYYSNEYWSILDYDNAKKYCKSINGTLPSKETLIKFNKNLNNYDLLNIYGWPIYSKRTSFIWSSSIDNNNNMKYYYYVDLLNNKIFKGLSSSTYNVFCEI